jgi:beta-1,2-xylosyltransferase
MGVVGSYRYRLDVDGYGWSSRWQKLLSTNSVVLKSTIYVSSSLATSTFSRHKSHSVVYTSSFSIWNSLPTSLTLESALKRRAEQPEWWTAQSIPWYHYIPLKYDYTDLWDVLAFLDGAPDGASSSSTSTGSSSKEEEEEEEEQEEEEQEEEEGVAEEIAQRGMELAKENLRYVSAFSFLLSF